MKKRNKFWILAVCAATILAYLGISMCQSMETVSRIELDEKALSGIRAMASDSICWDFCPADVTRGCPLETDCDGAMDCPGTDLDGQNEAGQCLTSNSYQDNCTSDIVGEAVECGDGLWCACFDECRAATAGPVTAPKRCG